MKTGITELFGIKHPSSRAACITSASRNWPPLRAAEELRIPFVTSGRMVAGLIHDIPSVKELIERIMDEANRIIRQQLASLAAA